MRQKCRVIIIAILFSAAALPWLVAGLFLASLFVLPSAFNRVFDLFVPVGVDAPDNWAVAMTRMAWLFIVSSGVGVMLSLVALWMASRRAA